ncbi:MAG: hypothetical protein U0271_42645 [Polyangiaceae bacterium]
MIRRSTLVLVLVMAVGCSSSKSGSSSAETTTSSTPAQSSAPAAPAPPPWRAQHRAKTLTSGGIHTCHITDKKTVECWGGDGLGQLGRGKVGGKSAKPLEVPDVANVKEISSSSSSTHTCAILEDGKELCWGHNDYGQVTSETGSDREVMPKAVAMPTAPAAIMAIAGGSSHTCSIVADGKAYCWGIGADGQLGTGEPFLMGPPKPALVSERLVSISAGGYRILGFSCAVSELGKVFCWGGNTDGELGTGKAVEREKPKPPSAKTSADAPPPPLVLSPVVEVPEIEEVSSGMRGTCAVDRSGGVWCWGSVSPLINDPDNKIDNVPTPRKIEGISNAKQISVGAGGFACVVNAAGGVDCWGRNDSGQLGRKADKSKLFPVAPVPGLTDVVEIAAGWTHVCALKKDKSIVCWGDNEDGQLGNGGSKSTEVPTPIVR